MASDQSGRRAVRISRRALMIPLLYSLSMLLIVEGVLCGAGVLCAESLGLRGLEASAVSVLVLLGGVALYALANRWVQVREQLVIARPLEEVFRRLATEFFTTRAAVLAQTTPPGTPITVEQTSAGPLGVGTTGREVVELGGRRGEWVYQVTAYDPPQRFARLATSPQSAVRMQVRYDLAPVPGGTQLTLTLIIALPGLGKLMSPFYAAAYQSYMRDAAAQFQAFLEA